MRAFVCEIDHRGLCWLLLEDLLPPEELRRLVHTLAARPITVLWALLEEPDAEAVRAEMGAGRHREACNLLMDRAVELLPIAAALPRAGSGDGRPG